MRSLINDLEKSSSKLVGLLVFPLLLTTFLAVLAIVFYFTSETANLIFENNKKNLAYWLQVGDKFQIERTITNFNKNNIGWEMRVTYPNYEFPKRSLSSKNLDGLSFKFPFDVNSSAANLEVVGALPYRYLASIFGIVFVISLFLLIFLRSKVQTNIERFNRPLKDFLHMMASFDSAEKVLKTKPSFEYQELDDIAREIQDMTKRINEQEASLREVEQERFKLDLAKEVSHDIRAPLSILEMLIDDLGSKVDPDCKNLLIESFDRVKKIADRFLDETRANLEVLESREVESLVNTYLKSPESTDIDLEFDIEPGRFKVDKERFASVISNLLNNSKEAMGSHAKLKIEGKTFGETYQIQIVDNGIGIPEEVINNIGKKGYSHGKVQGNGIGLYTAIQAIESFGGQLNINSKLGKGTTVILDLPC